MDSHNHHKQLLAPLRKAMADFDMASVKSELSALMAKDAQVHLCHPFGDLEGPDALFENAYRPLVTAWPDLERRDYIVIGGEDPYGHNWIGCAGFYCGTFTKAWLDIPATGHLTHMRFHEFYRFEGDQIVEVQSIWDIPEVMMQSRIWPMTPSLGREWCVPSPASQDGLSLAPYDKDASDASCKLIVEMLTALSRHPKEPAEAMEMPRYWHPKMNWYGPAGIGSARGIDGFRRHHQIPFLKAMPDRGQNKDEVQLHFFADGNYVAVTGWPDMVQTLSNSGWLGLPPMGKKVEFRSLDFWRIENGLIRENWVLLDLLDIYAQLGIDVFERMNELHSTFKGAA